jgi:gamma-glutamylcyclotransferase (GGCT)/AIG2-like uncharacterized protein YtfP
MLSPSEFLPLFAFGTLRRGEENHHYLAGTFDACLPGKLRDYQRTTATHGFPAIAPALGDCVTGELFFISRERFAETLQAVDILEDIEPSRLTGPYYRRTQVVIETGAGNFTAWAYVDPQSAPAEPRAEENR